jgi:SAM-dependent methyltransferase
MEDLSRQIEYWDGIGASKTFTHPLDPDWLTGLDRDARILDYGCGYGRITAALSDLGYTDVSGVDFSPTLIARGLRMRPDLDLAVLEDPPYLAIDTASVDLVLLFAVLCCIPDDRAQHRLLTEIDRVLKPGGLIYISDLPPQGDARNQARYDAWVRETGGPYGTFAAEDGAVFRHRDLAELRRALSGFDPVRERRVEAPTLNGHRSEAVQIMVRKRSGAVRA